MMKTNNSSNALRLMFLFMLLNLVSLAQAAPGLRANPQEPRRRRLVRAPHDYNLENVIPAPREQKLTHMMDTYKQNSFYSVELTDPEYVELKQTTKNTNIKVDDDLDISLPVDDAPEIYNAADSKYLTKIRPYPFAVDNVVIAILDAAIQANHSSLLGVTIHVAADYTDGKIGLQHGSKVAYIIAGNGGVANKGTRSIESFVVFDQYGNGKVWTLIDACQRLIVIKKQLAKQGKALIASFSGTSKANEFVDEAFLTLYKNDILANVAAGNNHQSILNYSPARLPQAFPIGGTDSDGVSPALGSNWGTATGMLYLPYCVQVPTFINNGFVWTLFCGTSGSTPQATGYMSIFYSFQPQATPDEARADILARTEIVYPPANADFNTPMFLLPTDKAFPSQPLLESIIVLNRNSNGAFSKWYDAIKYDKFCVQFSAQSASGSLRIGLATYNQTNPSVKVVLNSRAGNNKFAYFIHFNGSAPNKIFKSKNLLKQQQTFKVEQSNITGTPMLTVWLKNKNLFSKLLEQKAENEFTTVAFSSLGAATYRNVIKC